jgi:hypothetical protein
MLFADGYHSWTAKYDERGDRVEWAAFGRNGEPVTTTWGYHRWFIRQDSRGRKEKVFERATPTGQLVFWKREAPGGRLLECVYLDADGKPALDPEGAYHRTVRRYDDRARLVEIAYFGLDGKPAASVGVHRLAVHYDPDGGWEERSFGTDGKPVLNDRGFHRMTVRFDRSNHCRVTSFFGTDGKPVRHAHGYDRVVSDLGMRSELLRARYQDQAGKEVQTSDGFARREFIYRGRIHADTNAFDRDGKAVPLVAVVTTIVPGSMAETAGLKKGDVLLSYQGQPIRSEAWFFAARNDKKTSAGTAKVEVQRGTKRFAVEFPPGNSGLILRDVARSIVEPH